MSQCVLCSDSTFLNSKISLPIQLFFIKNSCACTVISSRSLFENDDFDELLEMVGLEQGGPKELCNDKKFFFLNPISLQPAVA